MAQKYYAVALGRKIGIFTSWDECKKSVYGYPNAKYLSFEQEANAKKWLKDNTESPIKHLCIICEKPVRKKGYLCLSCHRKNKELKQYLSEVTNGRINKELSQKRLIYIRQTHKCKDVFAYIHDNPECIFETFGNWYKESSGYYINKERLNCRNNETIRDYKRMPLWIDESLREHEEFIKITNDSFTPYIYIRCLRCNCDFRYTADQFKIHKGHNCDGTKSSGEIAVERFLKELGVQYVTQFDTLLCRNPMTNSILPYDFEIKSKKIIIEVQGEQHRKFTPRFHVNQDNFEYQLFKDKIKKQFAIKKGYKYLEIWYENIKDGSYKRMIREYVSK